MFITFEITKKKILREKCTYMARQSKQQYGQQSDNLLCERDFI